MEFPYPDYATVATDATTGAHASTSHIVTMRPDLQHLLLELCVKRNLGAFAIGSKRCIWLWRKDWILYSLVY